ncbi:MAG TPA: AIR synthase-related protein [Candidatus Binataceae bacterium]|nr:AIR synthase-related protein [Candidatus Binataceae bacterium]
MKTIRETPREVQGGEAKPGDLLLLIRPLGMGVVRAALDQGRLSQEAYDLALREALNDSERITAAIGQYAVRVAIEFGDLGIAGAALESAERAGVTFVFEESDLPLIPEALDLLSEGIISSKGRLNREHCGERVKIAFEVGPEIAEIFFDPEPAGSILIAVAGETAEPLLAALHTAGCRDAAIVGRVAARGEFAIELV